MTNEPDAVPESWPFRPQHVEHQKLREAQERRLGPDRRDGEVYVYHDPDIVLAVNAALVTGRPLLISGPSGCGKSSLALNVALILRRRYYEYVVTSGSDAGDLLYQFDAVKRLNDATVPNNPLKAPQAYVDPGPLWWALDPKSARRRGGATDEETAKDPSVTEGTKAVLLIDEIDKAELDFTNNLLVPIGSLTFTVAPTGFEQAGGERPLIIITNNAERELPVPFLRRCISLSLPDLTKDKLIQIAEAQIPKKDHDAKMFEDVAEHVERLAKEAPAGIAKRRLSAAEYLDTIRACHELKIKYGSDRYHQLSRITLEKSPLPSESAR